MSEVWILAIVPVLAWILARLRTKKAIHKAELVVREPGSLTGREMDQLVRDLSLQLHLSCRIRPCLEFAQRQARLYELRLFLRPPNQVSPHSS